MTLISINDLTKLENRVDGKSVKISLWVNYVRKGGAISAKIFLADGVENFFFLLIQLP